MMWYTCVWRDLASAEYYYSKEYSLHSNTDAWEMLKAKYGRKKLVGLVAIIKGHHDVFLNKHVFHFLLLYKLHMHANDQA